MTTPTELGKEIAKANPLSWDKTENGPGGVNFAQHVRKKVKVPPFSGQKRDRDIDHTPAWTKREFQKPTRKEVLDNYQAGTRLEYPSCNRVKEIGGNRET